MSKIVLEFSRKEIDKILDALEVYAQNMEMDSRWDEAQDFRQFATELEIASRQ